MRWIASHQSKSCAWREERCVKRFICTPAREDSCNVPSTASIDRGEQAASRRGEQAEPGIREFEPGPIASAETPIRSSDPAVLISRFVESLLLLPCSRLTKA
jgi:hypothetical protein